jgi:hypothetical protein
MTALPTRNIGGGGGNKRKNQRKQKLQRLMEKHKEKYVNMKIKEKQRRFYIDLPALLGDIFHVQWYSQG